MAQSPRPRRPSRVIADPSRIEITSKEIFERYLDHIGALITGRAFVFSAGGLRVSPDEQFMREIESDPD